MDTIESVAAASVAILVPYLAEAGKAIAKKAGEAAWSHAESIFRAIQAKFKTNPIADAALSDVIKNPDDKDNQASLRKELKKAMELDEGFLDELRGFVVKAQQSGIVVSGSGSVATSGGTAAGAGGVAVGGNVEGGIHLNMPADES